jgi:hypothetical protein
MLTRRLVLTTESARHPFRQRLPRHVLEIGGAEPKKREAKKAWTAQDEDSDWKLFALSFCAFFTAFYSFIF